MSLNVNNLPAPDPIPADRKRLFSCGSEYIDWVDANCNRCTKAYDEEARRWNCDLEHDVNLAVLYDGTVRIQIYDRLGAARHPTALVWPCNERVLKLAVPL